MTNRISALKSYQRSNLQVNTASISFTQFRMTSEETQISEELKGCYENLIVIDIGANLTNKKYGRDLDSVVQRAKDAGMYLKEYFWPKLRVVVQ